MNTLPTAETPRHRSSMAGSATVICLMSLCVVMSFGTATLTMLLAKHSVVKRAIEVDECFMAAEAAVDLVMSELTTNKDYAGDGMGVVSGAAGRVSFTAQLVPAFAGPQDYTIVATGIVGGVSRAISVEISPQAGSGPGFIGINGINMSGGIIDSYESSKGTYLSQASGDPLHAGSEANIQSNVGMSLSGLVYGNATPGPGYTVSGGSGVTGSTAPATEPLVIDPYVYAPPIATMGSVSSTITLNSGVYRYTSFVIGGGKFAYFNGDVTLYVDKKLEISGSGQGILKPGAKLTIHHGTDKWTFSGSGIINEDQKPASLTLYSATTYAGTISGGASFYGTIYAPNTPMTASGDSDIYGAVTVKTMSLTGGMCLHYDSSLGKGTGAFARIVVRPSGSIARRS
ncbi:MAG TPA: hypothetical protein VF384_03015 [Planctomycetota bacterium]